MYLQYMDPFSSVESSQTQPSDKALHYGMQAANIVGAVADAGVAGINGIKALWGLRALKGLELASSGSKVLYTGARRLIDPITVRQQEAEAIYGWIRGLDPETNNAP